ncbi:zinc-dependent metalloprotease [Zeaxanthinibacter enoshimensis]|uniref:Putative secreted protein (Por secretion system target) n=1 Tax=Zeaxanthinibacter enoshimensis TaxID=392009 RepID=A0A4R6TFV1_9FLAO|nr:zinc-dependent metalloprotease [Zeaxanthinibacter enoshimensis]TDQ29077.1 putative secreted protein (Por secretion system target) [Zeaxanthinibacter enoshimensis]
MNLKITLGIPLTRNFFTLSLILFTATLSAQLVQEMDGPVSQLTLDSKGDIFCEIHADDQASFQHYNAGVKKSGMKVNGKTLKPGKSHKSRGGAEIFVDFYLFDPAFPFNQFIQAATAFQSAVDIWAQNIDSDVPIYVAAVFRQLGPGVLGSAGPTRIYANAEGLERDSWYGNALADKLVGADLDPSAYDIVANFSTVFPNWYYGTDGQTPAGDFDFRTVVLHELGHGLGFFGSMTVDNNTGVGSYGFGIPNPVYPAIYDRLANSPDGKSILKENRYGNNTTALGDVLLGGPLTAKGPRIKIATNGKGAKMFTVLDSDIFGDIPGFTDTWLPGSSYSHLDFVTYARGTEGLMVPFLSRGLAYDHPGSVVLSIFDDIGWNGKVNREFQDNPSGSGPGDDPSVVSGDEATVVSVYPNPFVDQVEVELASGKSTVKSVTVTDVYGQVTQLSRKQWQGKGTVRIDLSSVQTSANLVFLQLTLNTGEVVMLKLSKQS